MAFPIISLVVCAAVFGLATAPLPAQAQCESVPLDTPVRLELPECWSSEERDLVTRFLRTELRAYGLRELSLSSPDATIGIEIRSECTASEQHLELQVRTEDGESVKEFLLDDVDAAALPRVLALAIAELYAKRCAEQTTPEFAAPTTKRKPVLQSVATPAAARPLQRRESRGRQSVRATVAAETLWYLSPKTSLRGVALGLHYQRDRFSVELGGMVAWGAIRHRLGSIDLQNSSGRLGLSVTVVQRTRFTLRASVYGELGITRAEGRTSEGGTMSDSVRGAVWALRAGPTLYVPLYPRLAAHLKLFGGHGGGIPIAAAGELIGSTSGSSLVASVGLALNF